MYGLKMVLRLVYVKGGRDVTGKLGYGVYRFEPALPQWGAGSVGGAKLGMGSLMKVGASLTVGDDGKIGMRLQQRCRAFCRYRAGQGTVKDIRLVCALGDEQDRARLQNRIDPHCDRMRRNFCERWEEAGVCLSRFILQLDELCAALQRCGRLVEADMAVMTDAEQLQIDRSELLEKLVVACTFLGGVDRFSIRNISAGDVDIDMLEQMPVHVAAVAFRVRGRQSDILVQVEGGCVLER